MLNPQGRVLYDLLLYKIDALFKEESSILIECDNVIREDLVNILKKYKLRKKISISLFDDFSVWGVIPKVVQTQAEDSSKDFDYTNDQNLFFLSHDPRINSFGYRLIYPSNLDATNFLENCELTKDAYDNRCLELGVSEGVRDLPPNNCFPLEANLVFLNGVSFSKGCYVGQELTARTHHTGVIRKRLMPLVARFDDETKELKAEQQPTAIFSETSKKECGKVRNWKGQRGLGLLRLAECLLAEKDSLILRGKNGDNLGKVETSIPYWWPKEDDEIIKQILNKIENK
ncbi:hypothetical protein HELRODRAFT_158244 [Helobdella robusta]|uniref:CAF17 C-terminal domain-containing protein n=1 Tax=Helobdella robusta TaxID=6412 RepID=T1EML1_HELRO|nr:hypothetical protein HELRODRAFT_158244 [Helobdella robusta]ESO09641.1 hypothetical protein HELRODRAFT_158244 [Helobdella robusta]